MAKLHPAARVPTVGAWDKGSPTSHSIILPEATHSKTFDLLLYPIYQSKSRTFQAPMTCCPLCLNTCFEVINPHFSDTVRFCSTPSLVSDERRQNTPRLATSFFVSQAIATIIPVPRSTYCPADPMKPIMIRRYQTIEDGSCRLPRRQALSEQKASLPPLRGLRFAYALAREEASAPIAWQLQEELPSPGKNEDVGFLSLSLSLPPLHTTRHCPIQLRPYTYEDASPTARHSSSPFCRLCARSSQPPHRYQPDLQKLGSGFRLRRQR
jgi:hypothetical protein